MMLTAFSHRNYRNYRINPGTLATWLTLTIFIMVAIHAVSGDTQAVMASSAYIDTPSPLPYAFNQARVFNRAGLTDTVSIYGITVEGDSVLLYSTQIGYADSVGFVYYAWPELMSLRFEGLDGESRPLSASIRLTFASPDVERQTSLERVSSLPFPFRQQRMAAPPREAHSTSPEAEALEAEAPESEVAERMASLAASELFLSQRNWTLLAGLGIWCVFFILIARLPRSQALLGVCVAAAIVTSGLLCLVPQRGELYSLALPAASKAEVSLASSRLRHDGYDTISWAAKEDGSGLLFVALRSPLSATVPVSAFTAFEAVRFKRAPLIVRVKGEDRLAAAPFMMAWASHE